jgi:hypothetical protein
MMMYQTVKEAMTNVLGNQAEGRFRVLGFQRQSKSPDETLSYNRLAQVYYSAGAFPKSAGKMRGSKTHDITIDIDLTVSGAAEGDVSALDSETSTLQEKALALLNIKEAVEVADNSMDELIGAVFEIIMDARNENLGLDIGDVSSRWITGIEKDTIIERGDLVVKTANIKYTCRIQEFVQGSIGNKPEKAIFNSSIPIGDTDGAGVTVENE